VWVWGLGVWAKPPIPQSPIPNPQSPIPNKYKIKKINLNKKKLIINNHFYLKFNKYNIILDLNKK
jgi:hypothetical protein